MGKINSDAKGRKGERELARELRKLGVVARRSQQFCGRGEDSSDIICENIKHIHVECKRTEAVKLYPYMDQAERDAAIKGKKLPVVFYRKSRRKWVVILDMKKFIKLLELSELFIPDFKRAEELQQELNNEP